MHRWIPHWDLGWQSMWGCLNSHESGRREKSQEKKRAAYRFCEKFSNTISTIQSKEDSYCIWRWKKTTEAQVKHLLHSRVSCVSAAAVLCMCVWRGWWTGRAGTASWLRPSGRTLSLTRSCGKKTTRLLETPSFTSTPRKNYTVGKFC